MIRGVDVSKNPKFLIGDWVKFQGITEVTFRVKDHHLDTDGNWRYDGEPLKRDGFVHHYMNMEEIKLEPSIKPKRFWEFWK